jgi:pyridoxal phosphate enzyme (YggS family)
MNAPNLEFLAERVSQIRARIANAGGQSVKLIAVTKSFDVSAMVGAFSAGCDGVGENYAQEVIVKTSELSEHQRLPLHFIGRLQSNKIKALASLVDVWESVDRVSLINEIARRSDVATRVTPVQIMLQVNSTNEPDKGGCEPSEVANLLATAVSSGLDVIGLMTVGPTNNDPKQTQSAFALVRKIADDLGLKQKSMGMTGDFETAVEQGSTAVRIGSALFGTRF